MIFGIFVYIYCDILYLCIYSSFMYVSTALLSTATIEYESELRHKNEMARVQAEISGKLVFSLLELKIKRNWGKNAIRLLF